MERGEGDCIIVNQMQKSESLKNYANNTYSLGGVMEYLNEQIQLLTEKEANWERERHMMQKKIAALETELMKQHSINNDLMKRMKHRRTSSQEKTFIFNQTNISSYYPIVVMPKASWACKQNLRSHLDSVRALAWHNDCLISSGEDSLMKVWRHGELLGTIREHLGPVYAMARHQGRLYTGGSEGVIRQWDLSELAKGNATCLLDHEFHSDVIWELNHSASTSSLLSSGADGVIRLFRTDSDLELLDQYTRRSNSEQLLIPTSLDWLSSERFVTGYVGLTEILVFDITKNEFTSVCKYSSSEQHHQINKVLFNEYNKLIMAAHEDKMIRFVDPTSNKIVKSLVAHTDAVTSITFQNKSYEFSSCSHDGSVRAWDIRKFKCLNDIPVHRKKYDEAANILLQHPQDMIIAVGGADGIIKMLYESD